MKNILHFKQVKRHQNDANTCFTTVMPTTALQPSPKSILYLKVIQDCTLYPKKIVVAPEVCALMSLFRLVFFTIDALKWILLNPSSVAKKWSAFLEIGERGRLTTGVVLDITDLALFPKAFKLYMFRLIETSTDATIEEKMRSLMKLASPAIPLNREVYYMFAGTHRLNIPSYSSMLRLITFDVSGHGEIAGKHFSSLLTSNWRDGRLTQLELNMSLGVSVGSKRKRTNGDRMLGWMGVWNCRGIGANGFANIFDGIVKGHGLNVIILTEIRVPKFICMAALERFFFGKAIFFDPIGITGGAAVVWLKGQFELVKTDEYDKGGSFKLVW